MRNPYRRTVLSAALDWHAICAMANQRPAVPLLDALTCVVLAAEFHEAPIPVRMVAWEQYTRCTDPDREILLRIVKSRRPLTLANLILQEITP